MCMQSQKTTNNQNNTEKKNKARGFLISNYITKLLSFKQYDTSIKQWNRTQNQEINPHISGQLIFNKGTKDTSHH